jgi:hypothetical protein
MFGSEQRPVKNRVHARFALLPAPYSLLSTLVLA